MAEHIDIEALDEHGHHHTRLIPGTPPATDHTLIPTAELERLRAEAAQLRLIASVNGGLHRAAHDDAVQAEADLETARRELEAARAGFTAPDDIVYNLVWVAARNEHTRSWLAAKGLVVMQREAFDKELADLHRKRGEAEARADRMAEMVIEKDREATQWAERLHKAEATVARVREVHQVHSCERDGHIWSRTPTPCVNDGCCSCGSMRCKTLVALDSPEGTP